MSSTGPARGDSSRGVASAQRAADASYRSATGQEPGDWDASWRTFYWVRDGAADNDPVFPIVCTNRGQHPRRAILRLVGMHLTDDFDEQPGKRVTVPLRCPTCDYTLMVPFHVLMIGVRQLIAHDHKALDISVVGRELEVLAASRNRRQTDTQ